ncbi:hypothetical protein TNCV_2327731 [Trichonephila clavipes]|nr:hypothetical protein TNCV_2327731 [Trichonephila clavipes]
MLTARPWNVDEFNTASREHTCTYVSESNVYSYNYSLLIPVDMTSTQIPVKTLSDWAGDDGDDFGQHVVAEVKNWCHHFQPEVCQNAMETS